MFLYTIMKTLYDIHTHHRPEVFPDAYKVVSILNTYPLSADLEETEDIYYSCGIHPWYMDDAEKQLRRLREILSDGKIVAVGEAGLDKLKGAGWEEQIYYFRKQVELAIEFQLPLIIHCVKAWDELIHLYKEYHPANTWIVHGFRGKPQQAEQLLQIGINLSIGEHFNEETIQLIPSDKLFIETDTSIEPVFTFYQQISRIRGVCIDNILFDVGNNVLKTFKL